MDENQIYYLGRVEKITIVLKQNSNRVGGENHYVKFADIPTKSIICDVRYDTAADVDAPNADSKLHWWNVIQICTAENRILQIAVDAFFDRNVVFFRVKHDNNWYGWYKLVGVQV